MDFCFRCLLRSSRMALAFFGVLFADSLVMAGSEELAQSPLFTATGVQPNIFFVLDDSGSMDSEILRSGGAIREHPVTDFLGKVDVQGDLVQPPALATQVRELCPGYNVLAFDRNLTYEPWAGVNKDGLPYSDRTLDTALDDPYLGSQYDDGHCENKPLSKWMFFEWSDLEGDGEYDKGECALACSAYVWTDRD